MNENDERLDEVTDPRSQAIRSLKAKQEFQGHLVAYLAVNAVFVMIWLVIGWRSGAWFPWPLFPIAGWGIGIAMHAWTAYGSPSRPFTEDQIEREMHRSAH
ncbi:MAG: 2TM domain-containing protein [Nocardioides sp.]